MIQEKCKQLNQDIHNKMFLNNYLKAVTGNYERVFTSLDVIEDCQDAIMEYESIPEDIFPRRTTLYIYGVLQALYCQQDGLFHLYRTIVDKGIKDPYALFEKFGLSKRIRVVRDDIAGHPADRKRGKEFYFLAKGGNSKYKFTYAGYTPDFKCENVDLKFFIKEQNHFTIGVLSKIESSISEKILTHKRKYNKMKLAPEDLSFNHSIKSIYNGISSKSSTAELELRMITKILAQIRIELEKRYNSELPESIVDNYKSTDYILSKFKEWTVGNSLYKNLDAEVFLDSLELKLDELVEILKDIDEEYNE